LFQDPGASVTVPRSRSCNFVSISGLTDWAVTTAVTVAAAELVAVSPAPIRDAITQEHVFENKCNTSPFSS
jgi:hypothetical protein